MFNSHIALRQEQNSRKEDQERKRITNWVRKYHHRVQPQLLKKYDKRINGFIKKIQEKPVIVHQQQLLREVQSFRITSKKGNISQKTFKFKDSDDWSSLFTPGERQQRKSKLKYQQKYGDPNMAFRSIGSQSSYEAMKVQYRRREQTKQINPPMKYTNRNYLKNLTSLPKFRKKRMFTENPQKLKDKERMRNSQERTSLTNSKDDRESQIGNISDLDIISMNNSSFFRRNDHPAQKTQKQRLEEEELKALAHNRLYFKQLIDIEQTTKEEKTKENIRQLLTKCGVYKKKDKKKLPKIQLDYLLQILKENDF